jgi:hypothetical protein
MLALREVADRIWDQPAEPVHHREGQDGQEKGPRWLGPLALVGLVLLTGLLVFAHGCGQHDHDDELSLPSAERPVAQP